MLITYNTLRIGFDFWIHMCHRVKVNFNSSTTCRANSAGKLPSLQKHIFLFLLPQVWRSSGLKWIIQRVLAVKTSTKPTESVLKPAEPVLKPNGTSSQPAEPDLKTNRTSSQTLWN